MDMQSEWHVETAALSDGIIVMVACHFSDDCACLAETYKVELNESVATRVKLDSTGDIPDAQRVDAMAVLSDDTVVVFKQEWLASPAIFLLQVSGSTATWKLLSNSGEPPTGRLRCSVTKLFGGTLDPSEDPINWNSDTCQLVVPITTVSDGNGEDDVRTSAASAPSLTTTTSAVTVSGSFLVSTTTADVESEMCSVLNLVSAETHSVVMTAFNMGGVPIARRSFRFLSDMSGNQSAGREFRACVRSHVRGHHCGHRVLRRSHRIPSLWSAASCLKSGRPSVSTYPRRLVLCRS